MTSHLLIEHGETRLARRIRQNRVKVALAIAAVEGILVLAGAIPWWLVVALALGSLGAYAAWGRDARAPDVRVVTWTAAVSQLDRRARTRARRRPSSCCARSRRVHRMRGGRPRGRCSSTAA